MSSGHERFMSVAIEEEKAGAAAGEQPFGAVVVLNGEVVCGSRSVKVSTSDTTAHSETLAIKYATQQPKRRFIPEAVFYSTCEPCPMCMGAVFNSGIKTLVLGARNADVARLANLAFNFKNYKAEPFAAFVGWDLRRLTGVLQDG